ncbi:hypothetical protein CNR29_06655 [Levilactobacillus brevis]|uniref:HTH marR-type domain-containing protein n=1 Tax=Levilactobacillus brevis TaxID=1580 RepID=A0A2A3TY39_LEVBR|nr:MarR family transcriptional regulator [Levilactobacillus brevis]PBQ23707.1 hypothetical protein CNR29_06655 [Levilactobacillus brevis]
MTAQEDTKISSLMRQIMLKKQIYVNHELEVAHGGLTAHQVMALMYIHRNPGIIQREIVTLTQRRAPTVSVMLKKIEQDHLIVRKVPKGNNRNKEIFLTANGEKVVKEFQKVTAATDALATTNLSTEQKVILINLLSKMNGNLDTNM